MRILVLQAGDDYVELTRTYCNIFGTKYQVKETETFYFDGRVRAPRKHLMKRVVSWINARSDSGVKIFILPGGALTKLLTHKIQKRTLYSELSQPRCNQPLLAVEKFAQNLRKGIYASRGEYFS